MIPGDSVSLFLMIMTMVFWGTVPLLEKLGLREVDPLSVS
jgi:hypothetical protein